MSRHRGYTTFRASPSRPAVIEPGPRTAQRTTTLLVVAAVVGALIAIGGTLGIMVYLLATGRI